MGSNIKALLGTSELVSGHQRKASMLVDRAGNGDLPEVSSLLAAGVAASSQDESGEPAICAAALGGHVGVVSLLLDGGANAGETTQFKETALHLAARGADRACVDLLVGAAGRLGTAYLRELLSAENYMGASPLHVAAEVGGASAARSLASAGADVTAADHSGRTPLMIAVYWSHAEVVESLLEAGADPRFRGPQGETALDVAEKSGHAELRLQLVRAVARTADGQLVDARRQLRDDEAALKGLRRESEVLGKQLALEREARDQAENALDATREALSESRTSNAVLRREWEDAGRACREAVEEAEAAARRAETAEEEADRLRAMLGSEQRASEAAHAAARELTSAVGVERERAREVEDRCLRAECDRDTLAEELATHVENLNDARSTIDELLAGRARLQLELSEARATAEGELRRRERWQAAAEELEGGSAQKAAEAKADLAAHVAGMLDACKAHMLSDLGAIAAVCDAEGKGARATRASFEGDSRELAKGARASLSFEGGGGDSARATPERGTGGRPRAEGAAGPATPEH